ncbi:MAG: hypothetical protein WAM14_03110 [Candidatus Nitrosopolaris sp.]
MQLQQTPLPVIGAIGGATSGGIGVLYMTPVGDDAVEIGPI